MLAVGDWELRGHMLQSAEASAEYDPLAQVRHGNEPVALLYEPFWHAKQLPPSGPEYPGLHLHCIKEEEPRPGEVAKAGHGLHLWALTLLLYRPASH
jgi:hypothetical protein